MLANHYTILDPTRTSNIFIWKYPESPSGIPCFKEMPHVWLGIANVRRDLEEIQKIWPRAIAVKLTWEDLPVNVVTDKPFWNE